MHNNTPTRNVNMYISALGQKGRNVRWLRRALIINHNRINVRHKYGTDRLLTDRRTDTDRCLTLSAMDTTSVTSNTSMFSYPRTLTTWQCPRSSAALHQSIDISCPPGTQQQTCSSGVWRPYYLFREFCSRCRFQPCMTASSSASWSRFSPPSNSVNGHVSTMWFMVCRWPQSQEGDWARPHLCKLARHGP